MRRRKRLPDGTLGPYESVFGNEPSPDEQIELLGAQLAQEKIVNMQNQAEKDAIIDSMGEQFVQMRLELIALKGGDI